MKLRLFKAMGLLAGMVLVLGACSKQEPGKEGGQVTASTGGSEVIASASAVDIPKGLVECMSLNMSDTAQRIAEMARPEPAVAIAPGRRVYWSNAVTGWGMHCANINGYDSSRDDFIKANPLIAIKAAALSKTAAEATYVASPKGEFEKSTDYDARVAKEKVAFESVHPKGAVPASTLELAWIATLGKLKFWVPSVTGTPDKTGYDADKGELTVALSSDRPRKKSDEPAVPVLIKTKMDPKTAADFLKVYRWGTDQWNNNYGTDMEPTLVMEFDGAKLIARELSISFRNSATFPEKVEYAKTSGLKLDHIPTNYEFPMNFAN